MINDVTLVGRLVKDSELRYTANDKAVGNFTLAVNRKYKNEKGEYETDFIKCTIFGKSAEALNKYAHKGDMIGAEGSVQIRHYKDKEGNDRTTTEILVEKIHFVQIKKNETKSVEKEENPYKDMSIKVESDSNIKYEESELPF